ncbi:MAG TPA: hypothetical protein VGG26_05845 [Terracidiphilus sp.]|jgi:hypothetical protein
MAERKLIKRDSGYGCAACEWLFMPAGTQKKISPLVAAGTALQLEFEKHNCADHPVKPKKPREDFSQAAARIVREATERS